MLYPLATVGFGVAAFAAAGTAEASGFLAAYLSGLILDNAKLPHRAGTRSFAEGTGWLAQIGLFVMLGLLVTPRELPSAIWPAVVVGFVLLLGARPVSVLVCLLPFRLPWRQQAFVSWAGLRGAAQSCWPGSRLTGVAVFELRLPPPTVLTVIAHEGATIVPPPKTVLRTGDELLLVTTPAIRDAAERRLRAVGRRGRLARWFGEHGHPGPMPST